MKSLNAKHAEEAELLKEQLRNECDSELSSKEADMVSACTTEKSTIQSKCYVDLQRQLLDLTNTLTEQKTEEMEE